MKNNTKFLNPKDNKKDLIKNALVLVESFAENSPELLANPELFFPKALLKFASKTLIVWCKETFGNKRIKLKEGEDLIKPMNKFVETLKFLSDNRITDEELLEALKNLHIITLSIDTSQDDEKEAYMLIDILRAQR